jgi:hypothetical protein
MWPIISRSWPGSGAEDDRGFFKISISALRRSFSLRVLLLFVEQVASDEEFFGDLGYWLSGADEFDGLGFELGGLALTWFWIHPG